MPSLYLNTPIGAGYHRTIHVEAARSAEDERLRQELCARPLFRQMLQQNGLGHLTPGQISVAVEQYQEGDAPVILFWQTGTGAKHAIESAVYQQDPFMCDYALYHIGQGDAPVAALADRPEERRRARDHRVGAAPAPEPREELAPVLNTLMREQREQMRDILGVMHEQSERMEERYQALTGALSDRARRSEEDMRELFAATVNTIQRDSADMQSRCEAARDASEDRFIRLAAALQESNRRLVLDANEHHSAVVDGLRHYAETRSEATEERLTNLLADQREEQRQMSQAFARQQEAAQRQMQELLAAHARADVQRGQELTQQMRALTNFVDASTARQNEQTQRLLQTLLADRTQVDERRGQELTQQMRELHNTTQQQMHAWFAQQAREDESRGERTLEWIQLLNENLRDSLTRLQEANQRELHALIRELRQPPAAPPTPRLVYRDRAHAGAVAAAAEHVGLAVPPRSPSPEPDDADLQAMREEAERLQTYGYRIEDEMDARLENIDRMAERLRQMVAVVEAEATAPAPTAAANTGNLEEELAEIDAQLAQSAAVNAAAQAHLAASRAEFGT